ncbi:hypothetical protein E3N88_15221 [Mikania micrantha]|uniref:Uncharacterized protein n=1 Tax=Mikania micrantha TaxID=192012 RepID=A0A5N6NWN6_9ASTR|nr:hypothetical protein E3N88_15221 [Mikania micrantha]
MVRKRENDEERIKTIKKGLLGSLGAHRGTRWPNKQSHPRYATYIAGIDSRNAPRYAENIFEPPSRRSRRISKHHHSLAPVVELISNLPGASKSCQRSISNFLSFLRMADNNSNANRSAARPTDTDDLAAESRRRIDDIVAQGWIIGERVPPYRFPGDTTPGHRLPPLGVPLEQAFAAHVACTRREIWRTGELSSEVETLRLQVSQLMTQHGQIVDVMQEHDVRITENRTDITETQAMVQASDAMLNAWAAQFIEEPPQEDGPEFEAEDLEEEDFDEDPNEDPEEEDDDGDAASDISHVSMDSD